MNTTQQTTKVMTRILCTLGALGLLYAFGKEIKKNGETQHVKVEEL